MKNVLPLTAITGLLAAISAYGQIPAKEKLYELTPLRDPAKTGGMPLMQALTERKTEREFQPEELSGQDISDLLYAAYGRNRTDGKRTIPTALNKQDLKIYLLTKDGAYLYGHTPDNKPYLGCITKQDLRKYATSRPGMGENGSAVIVITGDETKWADNPGGTKYMYVHAGAAMQNLYLVCASKGLNTVVCGSYVEKPLAEALELPKTEKILLTQIIGKPIRKK